MSKEVIKTAWVVLFQWEEVLLVKHLSQAWHITGVYWLPSWRLEEWETEIVAAIRELKEETWLDVEEEDLLELDKYFVADIKRKSWEIKTYWIRIFVSHTFSWELIPDTWETSPEWVNILNLDKYNLLPNIKEIVLNWKKIWRK